MCVSVCEKNHHTAHTPTLFMSSLRHPRLNNNILLCARGCTVTHETSPNPAHPTFCAPRDVLDRTPAPRLRATAPPHLNHRTHRTHMQRCRITLTCRAVAVTCHVLCAAVQPRPLLPPADGGHRGGDALRVHPHRGRGVPALPPAAHPHPGKCGHYLLNKLSK